MSAPAVFLGKRRAVEICMPSWTEKQILDRGETGEFNELQKDAAE